MSRYIDLDFRDDGLSLFGSARVVPAACHRLADGTIHLSHDCASEQELEYVLAGIEDDIRHIRKQAKREFEKARARKSAR